MIQQFDLPADTWFSSNSQIDVEIGFKRMNNEHIKPPLEIKYVSCASTDPTTARLRLETVVRDL